MKKILITSGFLLFSAYGMATPRSIQQAKQIAESFLGSAIVVSTQDRAQAKVRDSKVISENDNPPYYIFNNEDNKGFVIVSADDDFNDILGYSTSGAFICEDMPDALIHWLSTLEDEMNKAKKIHKSNSVQNKDTEPTEGQTSIEPLIKTTWAQGMPFNNKIPVAGKNYPNGKASTGCVATAMAQIMNYWRWPDGYASGRHTNANYKDAFVYYSFASYDWDKMLNHYGAFSPDGNGVLSANQDYTEEQAEEVSRLMYECGVATDMRWSDQSSTGNLKALNALMSYYRYNKYMHAVARDVCSPREYRDILLNELNHGRPMLYWAKTEFNSGHYFICDGFDSETGLFHFNWGWAGLYDGYYALSALKPQGTDDKDSGIASFSYQQFACVGCQPDEEGEYMPVFTAQSITLGVRPEYGKSVSVTIKNMTNSSVHFNGDIGIVLLQGDEIKYEKFDSMFDNLGASEYFSSTTISSMKLGSSIADGEYILCVVAKNTDGTYSIIKANYGTTYMWKLDVNSSDRSLTFTPITIEDNIPDAIAQVEKQDAKIDKEEYFTTSGVKVNKPTHGVFIKKTTYTDGRKKALKIAL